MGFLSSLFGSDDSSSTTSTSNATSNTAYNTDKRAVASDQAVSLTGDNNAIDRSTSSVTSFFDASNRSSTDLTSFIDNSNKSTNFADTSSKTTNDITSFADSSSKNSGNSTSFVDSSNRATSTSMTTMNTTSDFGAIGGAVDVLKLQTVEGQKSIMAAFDMAKNSGANSMKNSAEVLGFATSAIKESAGAFAQAADGGQSKMVLAALVVVGAVGVAFALR